MSRLLFWQFRKWLETSLRDFLASEAQVQKLEAEEEENSKSGGVIISSQNVLTLKTKSAEDEEDEEEEKEAKRDLKGNRETL